MNTEKTCQHCGGAFTRAHRRAPKLWAAQRFCGRSCADAARTRPALERFEAFVQPEPMSGCHLWTGATDPQGYGRFGAGDDCAVLAHRFICEAVRGPIPADLDVRHLCHTPACVNPEHLVPGTRAENIGDAIRAGRLAHGSRNGIAKLDDTAVARGRELGTSPAAFAREHSVAPTTARNALRGITWRHVPRSQAEGGVINSAAGPRPPL